MDITLSTKVIEVWLVKMLVTYVVSELKSLIPRLGESMTVGQTALACLCHHQDSIRRALLDSENLLWCMEAITLAKHDYALVTYLFTPQYTPFTIY